MPTPNPMHANGEDFVLEVFHKVFGFPAKIQGMALNALINTIDRAQTEAALKEAEAADRRRAAAEASCSETKDDDKKE